MTVHNQFRAALFVAPLLVLLSYLVAPQPRDLVFTSGEGLAIILTTSVAAHVVTDGRTDWFEGVLLLAVYAILALAFYFLP